MSARPCVDVLEVARVDVLAEDGVLRSLRQRQRRAVAVFVDVGGVHLHRLLGNGGFGTRLSLKFPCATHDFDCAGATL